LILAQGISFRYFNTNIPFWGDENNLYFLNNLVAGDWGLGTGDWGYNERILDFGLFLSISI
jgi:hypothetical protein